MATTINATTSGGIGITADNTGAIQFQSSGTNTVNLDTIGNGTFVGTAVMSSPYTMRNKIINGAMVIDQRNAGASVSISTGTYTLDRYQLGCTGGGVYTCQQGSTVPFGFSKSMGLTVTTADSSIAATDYYVIQQAIEGFNIADLGWGGSGALSVTLSFWVRSSVTGTYAGSLVDSNATTSYVFTYSISSANTWEQKTVTITGPTTGTWNTNNTAGIYLILDLGSGSNRNGTASSWQTAASYYTRTSGSTNWISTNGATFYITGVQLERGTVATPFEYRNYQQELAMCQRYYQMSYEIGTVPGTNTTAGCIGVTMMNNGANNLGNNGSYIKLPINLRTTPTLTIYPQQGTITAGNFTVAKASTPATNYAVLSAASSTGFSIYSTASGVGGTAGTASEALFQYTASAEL